MVLLVNNTGRCRNTIIDEAIWNEMKTPKDAGSAPIVPGDVADGVSGKQY
jgi:hypothetical protein